jgi:hypothetical protein
VYLIKQAGKLRIHGSIPSRGKIKIKLTPINCAVHPTSYSMLINGTVPRGKAAGD